MCLFGDGEVQRVGDIADAGQACGPVPGRFVTLHLLFGYTQGVGQLTLRPAPGNASFHEQRGQIGE